MVGLGRASASRPDRFRPDRDHAQPAIGRDCTRDHVIASLHGAALDLSAGPDDIRIALVDQEGETALLLGPFDEEDAVAQWRALALASGLVPMLKVSTGKVEALASQIGRLRVGHVRQRRPHGLRHRRPRFLVKRKTARLPALPLIYREPEMAAGAGA